MRCLKQFMDFMVYGMIILFLASFCAAIAPVELGGEASRMILNDVMVGKSNLTANETISNSTQNQTANSTRNQTFNATAKDTGDLWSWARSRRATQLMNQERCTEFPLKRSGTQAFERNFRIDCRSSQLLPNEVGMYSLLPALLPIACKWLDHWWRQLSTADHAIARAPVKGWNVPESNRNGAFLFVLLIYGHLTMRYIKCTGVYLLNERFSI